MTISSSVSSVPMQLKVKLLRVDARLRCARDRTSRREREQRQRQSDVFTFGGFQQLLHLLNQPFDLVVRDLQLAFVRMQVLPKEG